MENIEICKVTFGSEPKDYEIYDFILENWDKLKFSKSFNQKENSSKLRELKKQYIFRLHQAKKKIKHKSPAFTLFSEIGVH